MLKEALHNIIKHTEASMVQINITTSQNYEMSISDNGKGISNDYIHSTGNGINNMHKHAAAVHGFVSINNNEGTTIIFSASLKSLSHESVS